MYISLPQVTLATALWPSLFAVATHTIVRYILPLIRRRSHLIECSARLPGPAVGLSHPRPFFADLTAFFKQPCVPCKPSIPDLVPFLVSLCEKYCQGGHHGIFRQWFFYPWLPFSQVAVYVFDPDLCMEILGPGAYGKFDKGRAARLSRPLIGHSLLSLPDGDEWRVQRKLANPPFGQAILNLATEVTVNILNEELFLKLNSCPGEPSKGGLDATNIMHRLSLDILGQVAFSSPNPFGGLGAFDPPATTDVEAISMYQSFSIIPETIPLRTRGMPFRSFRPSKENFRFSRALARLNSKTSKIITRRLAGQQEGDKEE